MKNPLYIGTTEVCLAHLARNFDTDALRGCMVEFCDLKPATIQRRLKGELPGGEGALRLRCFLQLGGYHVVELNAVEANRRTITFIIAFRLMSVEDILKQMSCRNNQHLWEILQGADCSKQTKQTMATLATNSKDDVAQNVNLWTAYIQQSMGLLVPKGAAPAAALALPSDTGSIDTITVADPASVAVLFAQSVKTLRAITQMVLSNPDVGALTKYTEDAKIVDKLAGELEDILDVIDPEAGNPG